MLVRTQTAPLGFTLLEVLIAFMIAAPALILLFGQGATAVGSARTSALYQQAISRANSRLEALAGPSLKAGDQTGEEGGGFRWHTHVIGLDTLAPPRPASRATLYQDGTTLFDVTVELSWSQGDGDRHITLHSRRLGPASTRSSASPGSSP